MVTTTRSRGARYDGIAEWYDAQLQATATGWAGPGRQAPARRPGHRGSEGHAGAYRTAADERHPHVTCRRR